MENSEQAVTNASSHRSKEPC